LAPRGSDDDSLFVSSHSDDAALSSGALMARLASSGRVTVATVFSEAGPLPWSLAAYRAVAAYSRDPFALFETRRREDLAGLGAMSVEAVHLGYCDAVFRARDVEPSQGAARTAGLMSRLPVYPTYRFNVTRGRVTRAGRGLVDRVTASLAELSDRLGPPPPTIFAPLAVGRHVDHFVARDAATRLALQVVFYSDFPYSESALPERNFVRHHNLVPRLGSTGAEANVARLRS
jgi:LmbE family N-acetylglucosaminyl deacetylase